MMTQHEERKLRRQLETIGQALRLFTAVTMLLMAFSIQAAVEFGTQGEIAQYMVDRGWPSSWIVVAFVAGALLVAIMPRTFYFATLPFAFYILAAVLWAAESRAAQNVVMYVFAYVVLLVLNGVLGFVTGLLPEERGSD